MILVINSLVGSAVVVVGLYILLWGKNKELQKTNCVGVEKGDLESEKMKVQQDLESHPTAVI